MGAGTNTVPAGLAVRYRRWNLVDHHNEDAQSVAIYLYVRNGYIEKPLLVVFLKTHFLGF